MDIEWEVSMSENRFYHGDCLFCLNHDIPVVARSHGDILQGHQVILEPAPGADEEAGTIILPLGHGGRTSFPLIFCSGVLTTLLFFKKIFPPILKYGHPAIDRPCRFGV